MDQLHELMTSFSHEIVNKMQRISSELDLLVLRGSVAEPVSKAIQREVQQICEITRDINEYLSPPPILRVQWQDPGAVASEVVCGCKRDLTQHGISCDVIVRRPLPKLPLNRRFKKALLRLVQLSFALLPEGGTLKIETGLQFTGSDSYVSIDVKYTSRTRLAIGSPNIFQPSLKLNGNPVGLNLMIVKQILRQHLGKITFRKNHPQQGILSILIKVPTPREAWGIINNKAELSAG